MIPINALLTPYEPAMQAPPGMVGRSLGGLGDFLQQGRQHDEQMAAERERSQANQDLQGRQLDETTRYHDLLYKEHGEAQAEKQRAAKDKIREHLFDRLHKAKTPDEKVAVIAEFKRLGDTVEEGASSYQPTEESPPEAPKVAAEAKAKPGKAKPRIEPPEFAGYKEIAASAAPFRKKLGGIVASEKGDLAPSPETTAPGTMPPEIAALVPEGTGAKPSSPEAPKTGGGKFTVRDAEGNVIHEYDAPAEKNKVLTSITEMGKPFVQNAGFPEDEKAAHAAAEYASTLVGVIPEDKIPEAYLKAYQANLGGYKKKHIEGQGPTGPQAPTEKHLTNVENETQKIINSTTTRNKVATVNEWERHTSMAAGLLNQPHGFAQTSALVAWAKGLNGRAPPAQEMDALKNSEGVWTGIMAKLNRWDPEKNGELPPAFIAGMRGAFDQAMMDVSRAKQEIADQAAGQAEMSFIPYTPEERVQAKKRVSAAFVKPPTTPAAPAATPGAKPQTLEEWRAQQKGKK